VFSIRSGAVGGCVFRVRVRNAGELSTADESLHHLSVDEIAVKLIQLVKPKVIAGVVGIGSVIWKAAILSTRAVSRSFFSSLPHRDQDIGDWRFLSALSLWERVG
jgi:hypothetical protein